ncbi:MAG: hypothetical protein IPP83_16565 [Flavobacteriales bacterium]|nr:hypothetical protein [Flavobacteriales bacterium]
MIEEGPDSEQIELLDQAKKEFVPILEKFGLRLSQDSASRYFAELVFSGQGPSVKVAWSLFPTDYPYNVSVLLGWADSHPRFVTLYEVVRKLDPTRQWVVLDVPGYGSNGFLAALDLLSSYLPFILSLDRKGFDDWLGPDTPNVIWEDRTPKC